MALILHIETATDVCSVALADENGLVDFRENTEGRSHASILTVFIDELFKKNNLSSSDLDAVAISMGPGSYTGLRIGVSVAKGLCYGGQLPLLAVHTLQSMTFGFFRKLKEIAENASATDLFCPMIDARRLEVYTAMFNKNGEFKSEIKAEIIHEQSFQDIFENHVVYFFGNGSDKCADILTHPNARFIKGIYPSSLDMISLSQKSFQAKDFKDVAYFEPFYLKDFVATTPKNKVIG